MKRTVTVILAILVVVSCTTVFLQSTKPTNMELDEVLTEPGSIRTAVIVAGRDATIFAESDNAGGAAATLFTGSNNRGGSRRALIWFDVAKSVPSGSTITSVSLALHLVGAAPSETMPREFTLHQLLAKWGEGLSGKDEIGRGQGMKPTNNDATWNYRKFKSERWSTPGGDFDPSTSATTRVGIKTDHCRWDSVPELVEDVQGWLDNKATNFGWIVVGPSSINGTARRFSSREAEESLQPMLHVRFTSRAN